MKALQKKKKGKRRIEKKDYKNIGKNYIQRRQEIQDFFEKCFSKILSNDKIGFCEKCVGQR